MKFEWELLEWIEETAAPCGYASKRPVVSVKLMMLRLALKDQSADQSEMTKSVELSLEAYERASFFRSLRQLERRGLVDFVDIRGERIEKPINETNIVPLNELNINYVALTERGHVEALSRKVIAQKKAITIIESCIEEKQ